MARRISREQLLDSFDAELAWRRLELSALRTSLARARGPAIDTAARTAVALAYAHWEGYVVTASRSLLSYVAQLRLAYRELSDPYLALCLAGKLRQAEASVRRIKLHIDVIVMMRASGDQAIFPAVERAIQAEGNLKSERFADLVTRLGLAAQPFELHYNWLDSELLRRRNSIAHGEAGFTDRAFGFEALDTVNDLLARYRTAVQNAEALQVYRRRQHLAS